MHHHSPASIICFTKLFSAGSILAVSMASTIRESSTGIDVDAEVDDDDDDDDDDEVFCFFFFFFFFFLLLDDGDDEDGDDEEEESSSSSKALFCELELACFKVEEESNDGDDAGVDAGVFGR